MPYQSSKTYGHHLGLSAVFRQWRAMSHCNQLHGYALSFKFVFEADETDGRNWVVDFGALKVLKANLENFFDHKLVVAKDDPRLEEILALGRLGIAQVVQLDAVGCEAFAKLGFALAQGFLMGEYLPSFFKNGIKPPVNLRVVSCECREHGANGAVFSI